jgi:NAD(P) transhydrogenase subunit beta
MELSPDFFAAAYLVATLFFIFGLKGLASPKTAVTGNISAMVGMALAVGVTLLNPEMKQYSWILIGLVPGAIIGVLLAIRIQMTAMPQLVAILHSFVGLAAVLVALGTFLEHQARGELNTVLLIELSVGSNPLVFKGQHFLNALLGVVMVAFTVNFVMHQDLGSFLILTGIALALGFLLVLPIGGGDMPVIVSMLNSYSGWAAAATGFTLGNNLLITTGALVGSSGAILSYIMCAAMNRSIISVVLGGFGGEVAGGDSAVAQAANKGVKSSSVEDAAFVMENSSKIIIVPGYGMAVAQAQHAVKELYEAIAEKGIVVKFAIHPVAGRMPGHMNVLLAESEIPYEIVQELDEINGDFSSTDVVFVIGANDVVNPDAKTNKASPLYGMPILDAYKAKHVFVNKRSMKAGYAGVDNALFYMDNCSLIFGDAKSVTESLVQALKGGGH